MRWYSAYSRSVSAESRNAPVCSAVQTATRTALDTRSMSTGLLRSWCSPIAASAGAPLASSPDHSAASGRLLECRPIRPGREHDLQVAVLLPCGGGVRHKERGPAALPATVTLAGPAQRTFPDGSS